MCRLSVRNACDPAREGGIRFALANGVRPFADRRGVAGGASLWGWFLCLARWEVESCPEGEMAKGEGQREMGEFKTVSMHPI